MRVAVLTLTRDRLAYTKHCFRKLRELAGCDFDHYVLDQGSTDGTAEWLNEYTDAHVRVCAGENVGIAAGMNLLLHLADRESQPPYERYDVIVKFDNDCELVQRDTLKTVCELVMADGRTLLSPRILGLNRPPFPTGEFQISGERVLDVPQIGGIFLAAPASLYDTYRYDENLPVWGGDDAHVCAWYRAQGGRCGYVARLEAWHYETTNGQHARYPDYFQQKQLEGKAVL